MHQPDRPRGFSVADLLIVVAGLASGLAMVRVLSPGFWPVDLWSVFRPPLGGWTLTYAGTVTFNVVTSLVIPCVAGWTPACLLLHLSRPRPPWRRLRRQTGFVVSLIASSFVVAMIATGGLIHVIGTGRRFNPSENLFLQMLGPVVGTGVAAGWLTLTLCALGRTSPTWADRLARLTGALWVFIGATWAVVLGLSG